MRAEQLPKHLTGHQRRVPRHHQNRVNPVKSTTSKRLPHRMPSPQLLRLSHAHKPRKPNRLSLRPHQFRLIPNDHDNPRQLK